MSLRRWLQWRTDRELDEEIESHLDLDIQADLDRGLAPEAARAAALRRFGNRARVKERAREADPLFGVETFARDLLYGLRGLRRHPGFTVAAVVSLALGIAANSVIFSLVDSTLLKPLALPSPDRLVVLWTIPDSSKPDQLGTSSIPRYVAFRDQARSFEAVGAFNGIACGVRTLGFERDGAPAERILGQTVSPSLFRALGVTPVLGRTFTDDEDRVDQVAPVALISHRMWQRRFAGDPQILGKTMMLNRVRTDVIGVLPQDFDFFGDQIEFIVPLCLTQAQVDSRVGGNTVIGRLKPGVTVQQAQAEADILGTQLALSDPQRHQGIGTKIESLQRASVRGSDGSGQPSGDYGSRLMILQGAVAFVLLIACANVAGLLLARTAGRRQEVSLRLALGASRRRIVRQFLAEGLPLAGLGGVAGLALSWGALKLFVATAPPDFPRLDHVALDRRVLAFTAVLVVLTSVLFALVPALQASKSAGDPLKEAGRAATAGASRQRLRSLLVTGQMALALVLLIGAGLLIHSFIRAIRSDLGADPRNLLTFDFRLPPAEMFKLAGRWRGSNLFDVNPAAADTFERVYEKLLVVPGVVAVGAANAAPFGPTLSMPFLIEGRPAPPSAGAFGEGLQPSPQVANYFAVTRTFFSALRIPVLQGREFGLHDTAEQPLVMIINETMARQYFPGEDPIGKRVTLDFVPNERPREIIAVVGDTSTGRLEGGRAPAIYVPHVQQTSRFAGPSVYMRTGMFFYLRTSGEPMQLLPSVKRAVAEVDRNTPVASVNTVEQTLDAQVRHLRLYMLLLGVFGAVAAILAATGIYGVMAYAVAERTREIGIRMALGARASDVLLMVSRQAAAVIGSGTVLGLAGALALTRVIRSALVGVTATDPATYAAGSLLLVVIAAAASFLPARRAAAVDPTVALKHE
jgi:putative ABC transport system permease protein